MATALKLDDTNGVAGTDIVVAVTQNPGIVLLDTAKFDVFYESLKAKAPTDADVATRKGQEALRSFAATVRSEKAAIDKARLRLTKEWRDMTAQANEAGKIIEHRLESLAVEVRAPLTEWEEAEKARASHCRAIIDGLKAMAHVDVEDTAAMVRERGDIAWNTALDAEQFGDMLDEAQNAKDEAVAALKAALSRLTREEADRAELDRLRAENEAREAREREEVAAREEAERQADEERAEEQRRLAAERADAERIAQAERDASERATREAEERHQAELAAERRRAEEAERQAQAERDRIAAVEREQAAEAARLAGEQAAREADRAHRGKIMGEAKAAIMEIGVDEPTAKNIVLAIVGASIPHVSLRF